MDNHSPDYWMMKVDVLGHTGDEVVMDRRDHARLSKFLYGRTGVPVVVSFNVGEAHRVVFPQESVPSWTIAVPEDQLDQNLRDAPVLIAKREPASEILRAEY